MSLDPQTGLPEPSFTPPMPPVSPPKASGGALTLGQQMAQSVARQKAHDIAYARDQLAQKSAKELAAFNAVSAFFEAAKAQIANAIGMGKTKLVISLATRPATPSFPEAAEAVEASKRGGGGSWNTQACLERETHVYHPLWREFKTWAAHEDLSVRFEDTHDGGGMYGWALLITEPAKPFVPPRT